VSFGACLLHSTAQFLVMSGKFDLDSVCDLIIKHGLLRVALQFPDEFLTNCVSIYTYIIKRLANDSIDVFIIGDSTYGSSIDDISAQHVDSDVLIYFGSDLSSSGSVPVMVVPFSKDIDEASCIEELHRALDQNGIDLTTPILLIYELNYSTAIRSLITNPLLQSLENIMIGELPPSSNLMAWTPTLSQTPIPTSHSNAFTKVGGLVVASEILMKPDLVIWYIGGKEEQLVSINIRMSEHMVISYSPDLKVCNAKKGCETREFRERYGGLLRVKDAQIIGIIVGSMGLSGPVTQAILLRLETLISAAKKNSYVFIMGRLNEAKLCNFPEVSNPFCDHSKCHPIHCNSTIIT
jgi:diphthamide biosynthesis protein 2